MRRYHTRQRPSDDQKKRKAVNYNVRFAPATDAERAGLADKPDGYIAGWASTTEIDSYNSIIAEGAALESIKRRGLGGPSGVKLLCDHMWSRVAGVITVLEYRGGKLWIEAQLNLNISYARDTYEASKINGGLNFSIGFYSEKADYNEKTGIITYLKIDLIEVSVVAFPANEGAQMEIVKTADTGDDEPEFETMAQFEKWIVANGFAATRRDAHRLALAAKANAHLFGKAAPAPAAVPASPTPPVSADDDALAKALAALRGARDVLVTT